MENRQTEVQAITGPTIEEAISRMSNAGIAGHEIAQSLILTGAGLLTASLGPKGAGFELRAVADRTAAWLRDVAEAYEAQTREH